MGAVYEAEDLESGRRVALKVLSHRLDSPDARERFFREGRLAASINHPNSVYIFGTEEIGGTPVIAMELVPGGTLQERVRARGPLPVGEAVDCILQIIDGLEAAQRIGILHRDIKPSNCFLGEDGAVKIGDFGLSISTAVRTEPALTATGAFLGTPAFCSPEQLRGEELSARSDMYSVGATLFFLLTGRTPFDAPNMVQLLATVLEQRAPSPRKFRPEIPPGLAKAVLRCLEKEPGERFKNYADLAQALAPYGSTAPTPATLSLRFLAGILDVMTLSMMGFMTMLAAFGSPMAFLDQTVHRSQALLVWTLGWFCLATLYYALSEGLWGAAVGKAICRLRVAGPDRNPPGFARALLRTLIYVVPPALPYLLAYSSNPSIYFSAPQSASMAVGFSYYVIIALLFVTARRRNGFAALQDLLSGTRVVSRAAFGSRPVLAASEAPPPAVGSGAAIGPYHVLQPLAESAGAKWFLGYDLKLLRKVWIRTVPAGTEPVSGRLHNLSRVSRLRWLTGKQSPEENWNAFEALTGRSFSDLIASPQPWSEVRYWLYDLAGEISAAQKEGTLPELALDRVWITGEGRAKLLDFPAPSPRLAPGYPVSSVSSTAPPVLDSSATAQPSNLFLGAIAAAALAGSRAAPAAEDVAVPLPLHARAFLKQLPQLAGAEGVAAALKPLLSRVAVVSRWRRAALVGGCLIFPLVCCVGGYYGLKFMQQMSRKSPGLMELNVLLQMRASSSRFGGRGSQLPPDRQLATYIAHHYRGIITNQEAWSSPFVLAMIKGEARKFAEQSVAEHPAPTEAEIAEADAAVDKRVPKADIFASALPPGLPVLIPVGALVVYVSLPALLAALIFRGGLVLLIAGVTFVRKDGQRASRLRLFWRAIVAWSPSFLALLLCVFALVKNQAWLPWVGMVWAGLLAAASLALPRRGMQDRLAGTWPVPR
jgi:hypothetical protein